MSDNFKQVVNLQSKFENVIAESKPKPKMNLRSRVVSKSKAKLPTAIKKQVNKQSTQDRRRRESRAEAIDHVYNNDEHKFSLKKELSQIDRPRGVQSNFFKQLSVVLLLIIIVMLGFHFLTNKNKLATNQKGIVNTEGGKGNWYSVQLVDNETFYGFIRDTTADPIVLEKVYYNYNQISGEDKKNQDNTSKNIRLVKRGKESYGPDGTMDIIRSQVKYMEILSKDSKIRKAILDYEK